VGAMLSWGTRRVVSWQLPSFPSAHQCTVEVISISKTRNQLYTLKITSMSASLPLWTIGLRIIVRVTRYAIVNTCAALPPTTIS
jgi:hypothetical protein